MDERFLERATSLVEKTMSRRSMFVRAAALGAAWAVSPFGFLVRPASAACEQKPCKCGGSCASGSKCCNGYTAFCCNTDGGNFCPSNTHYGGYWKCSQYTGTGLCSGQPRWYLDCNADSTGADACAPGCGCHCHNGDCGNYSVCANNFTYGQCDTRTTYIRCRVVRCQKPCTLYPNACPDCNFSTDETTCSHDSSCLT